MLQQLESRSRGLATQLAERTERPLVVGDSLLRADEVRRPSSQADVVAIMIYAPDGRPVAGWSADAAPRLGGSRRPRLQEPAPARNRNGVPPTLGVTVPVRWLG